MQNLGTFHAEDGSGYSVLADAIKEIDTRNPALAARLLTAFEQWHSLTPAIRDQAEVHLKRIQAISLSRNSADIISRALSA